MPQRFTRLEDVIRQHARVALLVQGEDEAAGHLDWQIKEAFNSYSDPELMVEDIKQDPTIWVAVVPSGISSSTYKNGFEVAKAIHEARRKHYGIGSIDVIVMAPGDSLSHYDICKADLEDYVQLWWDRPKTEFSELSGYISAFLRMHANSEMKALRQLPKHSRLWVVAGRSASGKDTVIRHLERFYSWLKVQPPVTTRGPRAGASDNLLSDVSVAGREHFSVSADLFEKLQLLWKGKALHYRVPGSPYRYMQKVSLISSLLNEGYDVITQTTSPEMLDKLAGAGFKQHIVFLDAPFAERQRRMMLEGRHPEEIAARLGTPEEDAAIAGQLLERAHTVIDTLVPVDNPTRLDGTNMKMYVFDRFQRHLEWTGGNYSAHPSQQGIHVFFVNLLQETLLGAHRTFKDAVITFPQETTREYHSIAMKIGYRADELNLFILLSSLNVCSVTDYSGVRLVSLEPSRLKDALQGTRTPEECCDIASGLLEFFLEGKGFRTANNPFFSQKPCIEYRLTDRPVEGIEEGSLYAVNFNIPVPSLLL